MKKVILFLTLLLLLVGCSMDIKTSKFKNYEEAKDMIERGWIPKNMPKSATNIRQVHNLDTNESNGKFTIPKKEVNIFLRTLSDTEEENILDKKFIGKSWYSAEKIKEDIEYEELCIGMKCGVLYVVKKNGEVYYWMDQSIK